MARALDKTDWLILAELQRDGRLSYNQLGRLINMSAPAVADRVRRLERAGVISGYHARVDPTAVGQPVTMFVQLRCKPDRCLLRTATADEFPEITEIHKLTGGYCAMIKARAGSLAHAEGVIDRLGQRGEAVSNIVVSTQYENRQVGPSTDSGYRAPAADGWQSPD